MSITSPSITDIRAARKAFEAHEPRDLFYRAATELVDLAINNKTSLSLTDALSVLLQTWNQSYYRFRHFDAAHANAIEALLAQNFDRVRAYRARLISSLAKADILEIGRLFAAFERVLGPVGAAKSLHLLAPGFFPLWDRKIAQSYQVTLLVRGQNADRYLEFMHITLQQCTRLTRGRDFDGNILKALDEFNYCRFTKKWI